MILRLYLRVGLPFKTCALVSILSKKIPVWRHWDWRVLCYCNMRFHWKKISLPGLMHIYKKEILPVNLPTVRMKFNGRKYCGCRRWFHIYVILKEYARSCYKYNIFIIYYINFNVYITYRSFATYMSICFIV